MTIDQIPRLMIGDTLKHNVTGDIVGVTSIPDLHNSFHKIGKGTESIPVSAMELLNYWDITYKGK